MFAKYLKNFTCTSKNIVIIYTNKWEKTGKKGMTLTRKCIYYYLTKNAFIAVYLMYTNVKKWAKKKWLFSEKMPLLVF